MTVTEAPTPGGSDFSPTVASLGRRAAAFAFDFALLVAIAAGLGNVAFDLLVRLGPTGPLVGFVIVTAYFAVLNSRFGGGTIGKRLTRIKVVDRDGGAIGLLRSLGRAVVLTVPLSSSGWFIHTKTSYDVTGYLVRFGEVLIPLASIYLAVCDRRNRRGVHDWIAGTWVVTRRSQGRVSIVKPWLGHFAVIGLGACAFTSCFVQQRSEIFPADPRGSPLERSSTATLEEIGKSGLAHASSVGGTLIFPPDQPNPATAPIELSAEWKTRPQYPEAAAAEIAAIVFRTIPGAATVDRIAITITIGYSIGIWRSRSEQHFVKTPAQWQALLAAAKK